jgi:hypothetical protein
VNRPAAWGVLALLGLLGAVALLAPPWAAALLLLAGFAGLRKGRWTLAGFTVATLALNSLLFGLLLGEPVRGLVGAMRLAAVLGANLAVLSWASAGRLLDGLGLPARATAFLGAVLLTAEDLGRDFRRLVDAQRLAGAWPSRLAAKAGAAARLLPPLAVLAVRRARVRTDALRLAGHDMGPRFAPLVAVTAMAVAGRLATVALPNLSLAYVIVFVAGLLFGARLGAWAGLLGMAVSNLLITGLYLVPFANAPAMALVGAAGGLLRRADFSGPAGRAFAASCGILATLLFSVAADLAGWAAVPEFRERPGSLPVFLLNGLAFNVVPALANAVLFAAAVGPVAAAVRGSGGLGAFPAPAAPAAPPLPLSPDGLARQVASDGTPLQQPGHARTDRSPGARVPRAGGRDRGGG